jgi:hypothetical protein
MIIGRNLEGGRYLKAITNFGVGNNTRYVKECLYLCRGACGAKGQ